MKNARAKRAKILFSIVKYANLWGFCCRRRRGCLSSLIKNARKKQLSQNSHHFPNLYFQMTFSLPLPSLMLKLPITMTMTANKNDKLLVACVVVVFFFHYFFTKEKNCDSRNK